MNLVQIKEYIKDRKLVPLQDIAFHFKTEVNTVQPMLDIWVRKGKVKKHAGNLGCQNGCCKCDPATITTYEWLADG